MILSLAITTMNRFEMTIESFAQVIDDPRIDDIVILDDCSTDGSYEKLRDYFKGNEKVRVIRQAQNRGMSLNKRDAIALSKNEWALIFDSDNILGKDYLDALERQIYKEGSFHQFCIYLPSFAKPNFDYRKYSCRTYGVMQSPPVHEEAANCMMNTCNYVVNRNEYLRVYRHNPEMKGTDTIWFNYLWLKSANSFYVVPEMEYIHRVHEGSGFMSDVDYNMKQSEKIKKMILAL